MRSRYLSLFVLLATLLAVLASPTAGFADDDNGRGRGNDDNRRGQQNDDRGRDRDDDRRGQNRDDDGRGRDRDRDDDRRDRDDREQQENFRRVGICHATGSERHPFVFIRVAEEAVLAHQLHGDLVGMSSERDCPGQAQQGEIRIGDATCREGQACVFTITQRRGTGTANVTFTTEDRTAIGGAACGTPGIDYVIQSGTVAVGAAGSAQISIQTCTDNLSGPNERFRVRLTGTSSGEIEDAVGRGVIVEASATTGPTVLGTTDALGQITLSWGSTGGLWHQVYFAPGTACVFGMESRAFSNAVTSGTLTGLTPNTQYCFQVRRVEANLTETVLAATVTTGTTAGAITISDAICTEGASCAFTVTQTGSTPATVTWAAGAGGSAIGGAACGPAGVDFAPASGTVFLPANASATLLVSTCADGVIEPNEIFFVVLTGTTSGTITDSSGQATIMGG